MKRQEQFHCRFLDYRLLGSCLLSCLLICLARTTLHASESNFNALNDTIAADVALPDSLLTDDNVYRYTFSNFPLACRIMDELRIRKLLPTHRLDITEGDLYFNNGHYRHALKNYRRALESDSIRQNDDEYMDQLHRLISTYDCLHNEVGKAECVNLLLDKAKATGNQPMHSIALFNLGKMIYYQGNKSQGYEYMHQAVDLMFHTDYEYKYDNLRYNYNTLLVMQQRDKLYEEALSTLDALQSVVTREQGGEPQMQGLEQKELKALYAHRAVVLQRLGRHKEAEEFYKKFLTVSHVHSRDNYLIMPYLFDRRMYDEIIRMNTTREQFLISQRDSVNYHMVTIKRTLAKPTQVKATTAVQPTTINNCPYCATASKNAKNATPPWSSPPYTTPPKRKPCCNNRPTNCANEISSSSQPSASCCCYAPAWRSLSDTPSTYAAKTGQWYAASTKK